MQTYVLIILGVLTMETILIGKKYYENEAVRQVELSCGGITQKAGLQLNLFENPI